MIAKASWLERLSTTRLDNYLVEHDYYESRARAASAIRAGLVTIDGVAARKASQKVFAHSVVLAQQEHPWVSRGGLKLDHALKVFDVIPEKRICLDVGASTGGFTEVLLAAGAAKIYAVDVGRDQLHPKLLKDPRVISMETTDARNLTLDQFDPLPNLIVCDASFISATKVLGASMSLVPLGSELVTLVKPQFEVGRDHIGRGGLVKDPALAEAALADVSNWVVSQGWSVVATDGSPITGGDGNREYLLHAKKKPG